jgi:hypothetical protein
VNPSIPTHVPDEVESDVGGMVGTTHVPLTDVNVCPAAA